MATQGQNQARHRLNPYSRGNRKLISTCIRAGISLCIEMHAERVVWRANRVTPVLAVAIDFAQAREYFQDPSLSFPSGRVVTAISEHAIESQCTKAGNGRAVPSRALVGSRSSGRHHARRASLGRCMCIKSGLELSPVAPPSRGRLMRAKALLTRCGGARCRFFFDLRRAWAYGIRSSVLAESRQSASARLSFACSTSRAAHSKSS